MGRIGNLIFMPLIRFFLFQVDISYHKRQTADGEFNVPKAHDYSSPPPAWRTTAALMYVSVISLQQNARNACFCFWLVFLLCARNALVLYKPFSFYTLLVSLKRPERLMDSNNILLT